MKLYHNKKRFYSALDKLCEINHQRIETKLENTLTKILSNEQDLDVLLIANEKEFKPLLTQHCNRSGKQLNQVSLDSLKELLLIHGRAKSIELLKLDCCQQYAPLWINTNPDTLHKLMAFDTAGYFVYAASHIFHCDIVQKSHQLHSAPDSLMPNKKKNASSVGEAEKQADCQTEKPNDLLSGFTEQGKPESINFSEIPANEDIRFFNLQDKIIARRNIELYINDILITECNELLRRFLGLSKPNRVASFVKLSFEYLHEITESEESLIKFIAELKTAIVSLFENHFNSVKQKKQEMYYIALNHHHEISSSDIETIKAKFSGMSNFHQQPKIRNQTKKDSILYDLRGFWDEHIEKSDILKQFNSGGLSKTFDSNGVALDTGTKKQLNRHGVKKGFQFKIKVKTNA